MLAVMFVVSGSCRIDEYCFFGVNSTLRDGLTIGKRCVIGAGALVMEDCPDHSLVTQKKAWVRPLEKDVL